MIVATAVVPHDQAATIEPGLLKFLNSRSVLHWASGYDPMTATSLPRSRTPALTF